jgi:predicted histone-like DNA-binding protein
MNTLDIDWYENPVAPGQDNKKRFHPRLITFGRVDSDEVIRRIHNVSSLTTGDIKNTLANLSEILGKLLSEGNRVQLEGIGYFTPTLSATQPIKNDTKRRGAKVQLKTIHFRPDKELLGNFEEMHFNQSKFGAHSNRLSEVEIDLRLKEYFATQPFLTRASFQRLCTMARTMAAEHLKRLRNEGKLRNVGTSNQPIYVPAPGYYGKGYE